VPYSVTAGSFSDTGTATTANVYVAFDANARYEQAVSNILLANKSATQTNTFQVGFYFSSRVDTGTRIWHGEVSGATEYSYYFANGGINIDFDKGWRSDGAGIAAIYWRVGSSDSFGIANGTVDNGRGAYGSSSSGAAVILDNQSACGIVNFTSRNVKVEVNTTLTPGLGVFTLDDCPTAGNGEQFFLSFDTTWVAPASGSTAGFNFPSIVMSPANDKALVLSAANSQFGSGIGSNTTAAFVGIPGLSRGNILGASGWTPLLTYSPSIASSGVGPGASVSPAQILGDLNINQLWQYGIPASNLLYTDTAFAALPSGTTLYSGQIIAPPSYWDGANGKRYALDVVYQTGTTGSPNGGATACSGTSGTSVLTCTSATDLSAGELISIGTDTNKKISFVNATQPGAVLVNLTNNLSSAHSSQALSFSAPLLASEIQMPTKSASAPTSLAWSQGDMEENSGATANGIAAWVNVAAGTPGTWAAIPLGNSSGQIATSQIASGSLQGTDVKVLTAGTVAGTAIPLCTDANGGATTSGCPTVTGIVAVANGGTGASTASAALANLSGVSNSTTVNGHALSSNVTVSASDLTTGTLPHAQLPALASGDIPNNAANTSGTAAGFTGTLAGDVTGSQSATTVGKINGGSIPASANVLSTNASSQLLASTTHNLSVPANCAAASGSGTAYTCSTSPTFTAAAGDHIQFKADVANTGSATLAVNGATTAAIYKWGNTSTLAAGDIQAGHWISATYDGSHWQLEGQLGNANATQLNSASLPASANVLSTNASSQLVASTSHNLSVPANCAAASGSGTAYTCTTSPTFTPATGDHIQFKADVANTGSATLAVNGATAAAIKKWGGAGNLIANDLLAGHWISATFDGTYWQLEGQLGNANATQLNGTAITGLSGSGSVLALASSPVFTTPALGAASATSLTTSASSTFAGSANTFNNAAAAENDVIVQAGSGAAQAAAYQLNTYAGAATWKLRMDASNYLRFNDVVNSLDREIFYQNGQTIINSGAGANAVVINSSTNSGTGGLLVESGGSSPAAVLTVSGSGNTTATGFVAGKFMMGSGTMTLATGAAAGTSPTIACATSHVCDGVSGTVTLTTGTSPATGTLATLNFPNTHTNQANCVVDVLQSGVGQVTTATWSESTTAVTLTANAALTASTAYTVKYWCGGN
jgi:hypothetical protein